MRANIPVWLFNTLCVIAIIALFVGVVAGCTAISNSFAPKDGFNDVNLSFKVGCIDPEDGDILNAKNKLYTEDLIECTGFHISRDFSVYAQYEIHFFGANDKYIPSATVVTDDLEYAIPEGAMPEGAVGIRLVVVPNETDVDLESWGFLNVDRAIFAGMLELQATNHTAKVPAGDDSGDVSELAA